MGAVIRKNTIPCRTSCSRLLMLGSCLRRLRPTCSAQQRHQACKGSAADSKGLVLPVMPVFNACRPKPRSHDIGAFFCQDHTITIKWAGRNANKFLTLRKPQRDHVESNYALKRHKIQASYIRRAHRSGATRWNHEMSRLGGRNRIRTTEEA